MAATLPGGNAAPITMGVWGETAIPTSPIGGGEAVSRVLLGGKSPGSPSWEGEETTTSFLRKDEMVRIAYAHGMVLGDVTLIKDRRGYDLWRAQVSTTHPALEKAFVEGFLPLSTDGMVRKYPVRGAATPYRWNIYAWIEPSIARILAVRGAGAVDFYSGSKELLAAFTAGLFDTDGGLTLTIVRRKRMKYKPRFEPRVSVYNSDKEMLRVLRDSWLRYGIKLMLRKDRDPQLKRPWKGKLVVYELATASYSVIVEFLETILPYMKHWEKIVKAKITVKHITSMTPWKPEPIASLRDKINALIRQQVQESIKQAGEAYKNMKAYIITRNRVIERTVKRPMRNPSSPPPTFSYILLSSNTM